jgi:RNA polymerase sigma-70 factor (ECF subfamily)
METRSGTIPTDAEVAVMSTNELVALLKMTSDEGCYNELFNHIYARVKRRIFGLCLRRADSHAEAEDIAQNAFLQLHRKLQTFRGDSTFETWLYRLTTNEASMYFRKKRSREMASLDEALANRTPEVLSQIGKNDFGLETSLDRAALERAVAELPAGFRMVFILHEIEGFEHQEIAEMFGYSVGNSKSQLFKARLRLRKVLRNRR